MLSRSQRLNTRDFAVVFEKGRVLRHPLLQLRFFRRPQEKQECEHGVRAAFAVPRKLGKAVTRNALRRRVRERYRLLRENWRDDLHGCDLILFATAKCQAATLAEIDEALTQLLKRAARSYQEENPEVVESTRGQSGCS